MKSAKQLLGAALLLTLQPVAADENSGFDFALSLGHHEPALVASDDNSRRFSLDIDAVEVHLREYGSGPLSLDMSLGNLYIVDPDTPIGSLDLRGYSVGFGLNAFEPESTGLYATGRIEFRYNTAEESDDRHKLRWRRASLRLQAGLNTNNADYYLCGAYSAVDGDSVTKATNTSVRFKSADKGYYCGGVRLYLEEDGYIGLEAAAEPLDSYRLVFGRRF